jgi:hypothetical protein
MEELHGVLDEAAKLYLQDLDRFEIVSRTITPLRNKLLSHRVYGMLTDLRALRVFMEYHCYPVWDFMSLFEMSAEQTDLHSDSLADPREYAGGAHDQ